jgi:hypothetical protein
MLSCQTVAPSRLTDLQVDTLLSAYGSTLEAKSFGGMNLSATIELLYTPDLKVYSDSLAFALGAPLDQQPVVCSRQALLDYSGALKLDNITTLNTYHNCTAILWRSTGNGSTPNQHRITDYHEIHVEFSGPKGTPLINEVYAELNTAAFVLDVGGACSLPTPA